MTQIAKGLRLHSAMLWEEEHIATSNCVMSRVRPDFGTYDGLEIGIRILQVLVRNEATTVERDDSETDLT